VGQREESPGRAASLALATQQSAAKDVSSVPNRSNRKRKKGPGKKARALKSKVVQNDPLLTPDGLAVTTPQSLPAV